jgi:pheromone shutdown-related protein TraB
MENTVQEAKTLPPRVTYVKVGDKDVYLVGTAHISRESVEDVRTTVEQIRPESICIELCKSRHQAMTQADNWRKMDIFKIIRQKKAVFLLAQLILSSFYRRLGEKLGVQPGAEMLEGSRLAEQTGATLVLADRDIDITLKRVWGYLSFWTKLKLAMQLLMSILFSDEIDANMVEQLKQQDQLEAIMAEFAQRFPEIKRRLIDERDTFLAQKIRTAPGKTVVAVVGAGHVEGIQKQIHQDQSLDELMTLPPKSIWPKIVGWGIPVLIVALLAWGFTKGITNGIENVYIWILVTGTFSAVGAALALAHPLTILAAFLAAPVTTIHPLLAAGWVAGIVQAFVKRPKVSDLENLPEAIGSFKGFWTNPVTRILLIIMLCNIGATVGVAIGVPWIAARLV